MILEYLQPDASVLDGITVIIRALYYIATVGAAGLGLFAIGFGHRLEPEEAGRLHRTLLGAIAAGLLLSVLALALRVLVLTAGASIFNADVWAAVMRSRIGDAFWLRAAGLLLLTAATTTWRIGSAGTAMGALLVGASYVPWGIQCCLHHVRKSPPLLSFTSRSLPFGLGHCHHCYGLRNAVMAPAPQG